MNCVVIACDDDRDMGRVVMRLRAANANVVFWPIGLKDRAVSVEARQGWFHLRTADRHLTSDDLESADIVLYRPPLQPRRRFVTGSMRTQADRRFTEQEWDALILGLLLELEYRLPRLLWANGPRASTVAANKYHLIASATLEGMTVPDFVVSTEWSLPSTASGRYVAKAIGADEWVDARHRFPTTQIPESLLASTPVRMDCPALIQEYVEADHELRAYYLLGEVLALHLSSCGHDHVDIRMRSMDAVEVRLGECPVSVAERIGAFCRRLGLRYCVFDFLPGGDGQYLLLDVTPAGSWAHYEHADRQDITNWYVGVVTATLSSPSSRRHAL